MSEKDYAPLSVSCVRALTDKLYEKRKTAALEIERMVKEFDTLNNHQQIKRILKILGQDFGKSHNPNIRKGGLIGLAATAIALGKKSSLYVEELVEPVLTTFFDTDSRVRYYGCESLYNIVKVTRGSVLVLFNDIFDGLSKLAADADQNVRSGSELLDRLMKDIVTESCSFDLVAFIPLLRERIYTQNPFARQFIVSWVTTLHDVPDIDVLIFLPEILDGLFQILGDNNSEIRKMCEATLGEFLLGISKHPHKIDYPGMVNILISHSQSPDPVIKFTAVSWLKEFIQLSGRVMLPYTSGILTATLPCLALADDCKNIREASKLVNTGLMKLVSAADDVEVVCGTEGSLQQPEADKSADIPGDETKASETSETDDAVAEKDTDPVSDAPNRLSQEGIVLNVAAVVEVLTQQLIHNHMNTRIAALRWIYHLFIKTPNKMFCHVDELFPLLLKTLSDRSDEVVLLDLEVLSEISSSQAGQQILPSPDNHEIVLPSGVTMAFDSSRGMNGFFSRFILNLLKIFSTDRVLLEDRGAFIIRQLCLLLSAEDIYRCCSQMLVHEDDTRFAAHMIQALSSILLTSTELFELRTQLKDLKTQESCQLFCCLYKSWCHNPVATVSLCFLTQTYEHACDLLTLFGDLEVTVEFLSEIDKLVQLIESPIFTYLRLQMLDVEHNHHLVKSLYGLLMLLPQSESFRLLQHRLQCIPNIHFPHSQIDSTKNQTRLQRPLVEKLVRFPELLDHFQAVQAKHRETRRQPRSIGDMNHQYS